MFKRVGLIVGAVLLSILLLGYVFRLPLLQWVIAPELKKAGITLSCLDFSITSSLNIHSDKVCLNYQNQQLQLTGITANTKRIDIKNAVLTVNSLPKSDNANQGAKNLDLALPLNRPLISIKQLVVKSDELNKPLKISILEPELNKFNVSGDIKASAILTANKVSGQFLINDTLLKQVINTKNTLISDANFNIQQAFSFDGIELELNGDISSQFTHMYEFSHTNQQCQVNVLTNGKLATRFNLNSQALILNTDFLNNKINLTPSCAELIPPSEYSDFVSNQVPLNWQLKLPQSIRLEGSELSVPVINLVSVGYKQFDILITDTTLNITSPLEYLQTNLSAQINTPDINNISVNAQLSGAVIKGDYAVMLESLPEFVPATANGLSLSGRFDISEFIDSKPIGLINAKLTLNSVDAFDISAVQYQGDLTAKMDKQLNAEVALTQQLKSAEYKEFKVTDISNTLTANANLGVGELFADLTAKTNIKAVNSPDIKLNNIKVESTGLQSRALKASHHAFINDVELVINHHVSSQAHPFEVIIPEQSTLPLNAFIRQFEPLAQLTKGEFNGYISGDVNLQNALFNIGISHASALYNDYLASDLNSTFSGEYNSGKLNVKPTTFNLNEFRAGAVVKAIEGQWQVNSNTALINDVKGSVFGGEFSLDSYTVGKPNQVANVKFENIDASKLVTFDDKSGIVLTGRLAGSLPVHFDSGKIEIIDGSLFSQGTSNLKITNNAAFDSVMQQQQELQPVLGLLTNLDIQKLNSSVALKNDGWLKLGVNLQGYNKAEQQQVNFNYNHEENVFTLLRALRLSDEITQKVEQQYSQKGN
ncbi:YdbH domain-containing protein [Pseudoalteromonas sp. SG45-5]|uniref:YdbH domain-containing protein n=1 Tax=unclassified Pseudoalteromonas TaxID=194690 RepID=UPI0015FE6BFE|nr:MULTISPECIES: YdbH domain-containing protein [unclassified Pseudoalteromonas]MBB1384540.1 YdbH domain-containing protein [Pseudoalteromonas sp. SG45-5]MBB1393256.1 YdbH domain-containing protein [Pseudoalteromonas sp. SG44-4]MBB1447131.1 YdbH domain-containing protein [Pseudoalteromonas sp. SG41-6]